LDFWCPLGFCSMGPADWLMARLSQAGRLFNRCWYRRRHQRELDGQARIFVRRSRPNVWELHHDDWRTRRRHACQFLQFADYRQYSSRGVKLQVGRSGREISSLGPWQFKPRHLPGLFAATRSAASGIVARRASPSHWKFGRTSAPLWPQASQTNSGSRSDSRTSSDHLSPLIAVEWLHL